MKQKKLIIISGITGSMGQELLRKYLVEQDVLVYGISRKGVPIGELTTLPDHHLIVSVDLHNPVSIEEFVSKIPSNHYKSITYFHLVGEFKTEITKAFEVKIENDADKDGIDDSVYSLVAKAYQVMVSALVTTSTTLQCELNVTSFGSLADEHNIDCFSSFRKSRAIVKVFSEDLAKKYSHINFYLFNTSTILAADEMLERPFIFATVVNPVYWITPIELIQKTIGYMELEKGVVQRDIYLSNPNFSSDYFSNEPTYKRRVKELYNTTI